MRRLSLFAACLLAAAAVPAALADTRFEATLAGHASCRPSAWSCRRPTRRATLVSGKFTGPGRASDAPMSIPGDTGPAHGGRPTGIGLPLIGQPLQGFSGMNRAADGYYGADRQRLRLQAQQRRRAADLPRIRAGFRDRRGRGARDRVPARPRRRRAVPHRPRGDRGALPHRRRLRPREHPAPRRRGSGSARSSAPSCSARRSTAGSPGVPETRPTARSCAAPTTRRCPAPPPPAPTSASPARAASRAWR